MMLISMGDQVEEGLYRFHSRFNRAVNFAHGNHLLSVVSEEVGDGPLNIVMRDLDNGETQNPLEISADKIVFENGEFPFTNRHRYCSALKCETGTSPRFRNNLSVFGELLKTMSHPQSLAFLLDNQRIRNFQSGFERAFAEQAERSVNQIFHGDWLNGVRSLSGCGFGLTPSGDDFIAGLLIGLNLRGESFRALVNQVFAAAQSKNIFSRSFLDLARQGLLFGRMKNLILALLHGGQEAVRNSAEKLFAVGGTSGADLGTGFLMTMRHEVRVS
jgi:hypothetical protein